jgi:hypothetical protein
MINSTSGLEREERARCGEITVRPNTAQERQQYEDMCWVLDDPAIRAKYQGEFVVPFKRVIVAHGKEPGAVRLEAAHITGEDPTLLPLVPIDDSLPDLSPDPLNA